MSAVSGTRELWMNKHAMWLNAAKRSLRDARDEMYRFTSVKQERLMKYGIDIEPPTTDLKEIKDFDKTSAEDVIEHVYEYFPQYYKLSVIICKLIERTEDVQTLISEYNSLRTSFFNKTKFSIDSDRLYKLIELSCSELENIEHRALDLLSACANIEFDSMLVYCLYTQIYCMKHNKDYQSHDYSFVLVDDEYDIKKITETVVRLGKAGRNIIDDYDELCKRREDIDNIVNIIVREGFNNIDIDNIPLCKEDMKGDSLRSFIWSDDPALSGAETRMINGKSSQYCIPLDIFSDISTNFGEQFDGNNAKMFLKLFELMVRNHV